VCVLCVCFVCAFCVCVLCVCFVCVFCVCVFCVCLVCVFCVSPGKNTGVGCHVLLQCMKVKSESEVAQSCPILSDPMDCSPPGSSVHGIFQARVLEWGAIAFSEGGLACCNSWGRKESDTTERLN